LRSNFYNTERAAAVNNDNLAQYRTGGGHIQAEEQINDDQSKARNRSLSHGNALFYYQGCR
jgi:hypothetical protein